MTATSSQGRVSLGLCLDIDDVLCTWEETGAASIFAAAEEPGGAGTACYYKRSTSSLSNSEMLYQHWEEQDADTYLDLNHVQTSLRAAQPVVVPSIDITPFLLQHAQAPVAMHAAQAPAQLSSFFSAGPAQPAPHHPHHPQFTNGVLDLKAGGAAKAAPTNYLPVPPLPPQQHQQLLQRQVSQQLMATSSGLLQPCPVSNMPQLNLNVQAQQLKQSQAAMLPGNGLWSPHAPACTPVPVPRGFSMAEPAPAAPLTGPFTPGQGGSQDTARPHSASSLSLPLALDRVHALPVPPAPSAHHAQQGRVSHDMPCHFKPLQHCKKEDPQQSCSSSTSTDMAGLGPEHGPSGRTPLARPHVHCLDLRCPPIHTSHGSACSLQTSSKLGTTSVLNLAGLPDHSQGGTPTGGCYGLKSHCSTARTDAAMQAPGSPAGAAMQQLAACGSGSLAPLPTARSVQQRPFMAMPEPVVVDESMQRALAQACSLPDPTASSAAAMRPPGGMGCGDFGGLPVPEALPHVGLPPLCAEGAGGAMDCAAFAHMPADWVHCRAQAVERYRQKRARRAYTKKIRYQLRKINADRRPRIKGRFVKKEEMHLYPHLFAAAAAANQKASSPGGRPARGGAQQQRMFEDDGCEGSSSHVVDDMGEDMVDEDGEHGDDGVGAGCMLTDDAAFPMLGSAYDELVGELRDAGHGELEATLAELDAPVGPLAGPPTTMWSL